jgi:hypothetical protein
MTTATRDIDNVSYRAVRSPGSFGPYVCRVLASAHVTGRLFGLANRWERQQEQIRNK